MNNLKTIILIGIIAISLLIIVPSSFASDSGIDSYNDSVNVNYISTDFNSSYLDDNSSYNLDSDILNENTNYNLDSDSNDAIYVATNGSDDNGDGSESSPYASISKAINSSSNSNMSSINIKEGTYIINTQLDIQNKDVVGLGNVIFDLNNSANGFYAKGAVSFSNIKFINGNGTKTYGYSPIKASSSSGKLLTINNCTFENCYGNYAGAVTTYYGGAANMIIINSIFRNCHSTGYGGAISVSSSRFANITDSIFEDCSANYGGSIAFFNTKGGSKVNNCLFINSSAIKNQSIIYAKGLENLDFNFWGNNSKPDNNLVSSVSKIDKWVVLNLIANTSFVSVGNQIPFGYDFTKYTDGINNFTLENQMPNLIFSVNSKLGKFSNNTISTENGKASNIYTPENMGDETVSILLKNDIVDNYNFRILASSDSIIFVSDVGNDKTGNGSIKNPYKTIQYALSQVTNVKNVIYIKKGIYKENNLEIFKNVTIIGEDKYSTIIDGDNNGRIFVFNSDVNAEIDSLTLINGLPDYSSDDFTVAGKGGAIYLSYGNLLLNDVIISNSKSAAGGAIAIDAGSSGSLKIINSQFINNALDQDAYDVYSFDILGGGAIYSNVKNLMIVNSTFTNNSNVCEEAYGGAILIADSGVIDNCTFINNSASSYGGAIAVNAYNSSNILIINNKFYNNSANNGGAIFSDMSKLTTIKNNIFISNHANEGGAISAYYLKTFDVIEDNTFSMNNATKAKVISIKYANVLFNNNIFNDTNSTSNVIYLNNGKINGNLTFINNKTITVLHDSSVNLTALLTDAMGNPITNANITFILNNEIIGNEITDDYGVATLNYKTNGTLADYVLTGILKNSDSNYHISVLNGSIKVSKYYWFIGSQGYFTLEDAVNASNEGDVIIGLPGVYYFDKELAIGDRMKKIYKNVTIKANNLGDIILVGVNTRIFNIAAKYYGSYTHRPSLLNLENMIIENCSAEYGGAIYNDGYLYLNNCVFKNNKATNADAQSKWQGGSILNWRFMSINNCTFEDNSALCAGAIYSESMEGNASIFNTKFIDNHATNDAGAIYFGLGYNTIENCSFIKNTAGTVAGAIAAFTDVIVKDTIFINNTANDAAGSIYSTSGNFTADNITIIGSSAKYGGALYLVPGITYYTTYVNGSYYAEVDIEIYNLTNSYFENNHAYIDGGVIFEGYSKVSTGFINNCTFVNNSAIGNGSVLSNNMGNVTINNSKFINNTGVNGTLFNRGNIVDDLMGSVEYPGNMFIYNSEFNDNAAIIGGTILNNDNISTVIIKDSKFRNQSSKNYGGVIFNNGFISLRNNLMINCSSKIGNCIYNNGTMDLVYLTFLDNKTVKVKTYISRDVTLNANVTDDMGNPITGKYLIFNINGTNISEVYVNEGLAIINYTVPYDGEYLVSGVYDLSNSSTKTGVLITLEKIKSKFVYENTTINLTGDYVIKLLDNGDNPLVNKIVNITIVSNKININKNYITDENGSIIIKYLLSGNYSISGIYDGDENTIASNFTSNLLVNKFETNISIKYDNRSINAKLTCNGKPLSNEDIRISLFKPTGIITHIFITDNDGMIYLNNLSCGNYLVAASFNGTEMYLPSSSSLNIDVPKSKVIITVNDMVQKAVDFYHGERGSYFNVSVKDEYGNPLINKTINIGFNGVSYKVITDSKGIARLQINLAWANVYTFAVAFLSTDEYEGSFAVSKITILKKPTSMVVPKKTFKLNTKVKIISINLMGDKTLGKGSVPAINRIVKVTVNHKTYTARTNSKGIANIKVNVVKRGTYTVIAKFAGDGTFASKSAKSTLIIK
ncbi:MAG: hypothetical protein ACI4VU_01845 [Methanobrevibacter sp.]